MLEHLTITDEKAAAAFANARTRAILFALMKSDQSLSHLRSKLGMSLSLLQYHVGRLQLLGLVTVSGTKQRAGRAIKMYGAVASEFRVPGSIAPSAAGSGLKKQLEIALENADMRHPTNTTYWLDEHGIPRMRRLRRSDTDAIQVWCRLRLDAGAAAKLSQELRDLLASYEPTHAHGGQSHLCYFALVKSEH